jgi:hypothetical protein
MPLLGDLQTRVRAMQNTSIYLLMEEDVNDNKLFVVTKICKKELSNESSSKGECQGCNKKLRYRLLGQLQKKDAAGPNAVEIDDAQYTFPKNSLGLTKDSSREDVDDEETFPPDNRLLITEIFRFLQLFKEKLEVYDGRYHLDTIKPEPAIFDQIRSDMELEHMWCNYFVHHLPRKNDVWIGFVLGKPVVRFCNNACFSLIGGKKTKATKSTDTPISGKKRKARKTCYMSAKDKSEAYTERQVSASVKKTVFGRYFHRVVNTNEDCYLSRVRGVLNKLTGMKIMDNFLRAINASLWLDDELFPNIKSENGRSTRKLYNQWKENYIETCALSPFGLNCGANTINKQWQPLVENRKTILLLRYNSRFPPRENPHPTEPANALNTGWDSVRRQLMHFPSEYKVFENDQVAYYADKGSRWFTASAGVGKVSVEGTQLLRLSIMGETGYDYTKLNVIGDGSQGRLTRHVMVMQNHPEWIYNVVYRSEKPVTGLKQLLKDASATETEKVEEVEEAIKGLAKLCLFGNNVATNGDDWTVEIVYPMVCATRDYRCETNPVIPIPGMTISKGDLEKHFPQGLNGGIGESTNKALLEFILPLDMNGQIVHMKTKFDKDTPCDGKYLTSMVFAGTVLVFGPETHTNSFNRSSNTGNPHIKGFLICRKKDSGEEIPSFQVGNGCIPAGMDAALGMTVPTYMTENDGDIGEKYPGGRVNVIVKGDAEKWFTGERIRAANEEMAKDPKAEKLLGLLKPGFCRLLCVYTLPTIGTELGLERNRPANATMLIPEKEDTPVADGPTDTNETNGGTAGEADSAGAPNDVDGGDPSPDEGHAGSGNGPGAANGAVGGDTSGDTSGGAGEI